MNELWFAAIVGMPQLGWHVGDVRVVVDHICRVVAGVVIVPVQIMAIPTARLQKEPNVHVILLILL
jgi:hypothetical protein